MANLLAQGCSQDEAYEGAGYKPNRHNASRLMNTNETIRARMREIQAENRAEMRITVESMTKLFQAAHDDAKADGAHSASVSALNSIMKLHGLEVDPRQNARDPLTVNLQGFSDEAKPNGKANGVRHGNGKVRHDD